MIQIRRGIFETNSSSTHSVSISNKSELQPSTLQIAEDGYIHTHLDGYGWEVCTYSSQEDLLSYLVTMIAEIYDHDVWCVNEAELNAEIQKIQEIEDFRILSDEIALYTGAKGIILDEQEGYVDHQSVHGKSLAEYLDYWDTSILGFIFGGTIVHTCNDNDY